MGFFSNEFEPACEAALEKYWGLDKLDHSTRCDIICEAAERYQGWLFDNKKCFDLHGLSQAIFTVLLERNLFNQIDNDYWWTDMERDIIASVDGYNGHTFTYEDFRYWAYAEEHERG